MVNDLSAGFGLGFPVHGSAERIRSSTVSALQRLRIEL